MTRKSGYRLINVSNTSELEQALRQGGWDLLLTDLADSQAVRGRVTGAAAPMVVPVAYHVTGSELAQAKKEYQRVLKGPIKTYAFLTAIDDALAQRAKLLKSKTVYEADASAESLAALLFALLALCALATAASLPTLRRGCPPLASASPASCTRASTTPTIV